MPKSTAFSGSRLATSCVSRADTVTLRIHRCSIASFHPWHVSGTEAQRIQQRLLRHIQVGTHVRDIRYIAGADIAVAHTTSTVYASVVVLDYTTLAVVERKGTVSTTDFPYIPGLLSFREAPALLQLVLGGTLPCRPHLRQRRQGRKLLRGEHGRVRRHPWLIQPLMREHLPGRAGQLLVEKLHIAAGHQGAVPFGELPGGVRASPSFNVLVLAHPRYDVRCSLHRDD